jgi:hypothetical protein
MVPKEAREFETRCPVIRSGMFPVATIVDISLGENIMRVLSFGAELAWIRETESTWALLDRTGRAIFSGSTYSDFYGLATSVRDPVREASARARELGLLPGMGIEAVVTVTVRDCPAVPVGEPGSFKGMRRFRPPPEGWLDGARKEEITAWLATPWDRRGDSGFALPAIGTGGQAFVAWSSFDGEESIASRHAALLGAVLDGLPDAARPGATLALDKAYRTVAPAAGKERTR